MIRSINNGEPEMANKQRRLCALPNRQSINILRRRRRRRSLTRSSKVTVNVKNREKQRQMEEGRKEGRKGLFPFHAASANQPTNERRNERKARPHRAQQLHSPTNTKCIWREYRSIHVHVADPSVSHQLVNGHL